MSDSGTGIDVFEGGAVCVDVEDVSDSGASVGALGSDDETLAGEASRRREVRHAFTCFPLKSVF